MWLLLFLLWMILNGRVTLELVIFGLVIASVITAFAYRVIGYPLSFDLRVIRNSPVFLLYFADLIYEILKSAFLVMRMIFAAQEPEPVMIEFYSGFGSDLQNVLLANSITLTPGTITVFQEGDHFVIHALRREMAEGIEDSFFVKILGKLS